MALTRRQMTQGLAGLVAATGTGVPLAAVAQAPDTEALALRLQRDLEARVRPGCPVTRLDVIRFDLRQTASGRQETFRLDAVVRLTWPPGLRQRPFLFYGPEPEVAFQALLKRVVTEFTRLHPSCIA